MNAPLRAAVCSHSISVRLSRKLAVLTMLVLGLVFAAAWVSVRMFVIENDRENLSFRSQVISGILEAKASTGGEAACVDWLQAEAPMRADSRIEMRSADGRLLFADPVGSAHALSRHVLSHDFALETPGIGGGRLLVRYTMDFESSARMGRHWAVVLVLLTIVAGGIVAAGTYGRVRRQLRPLADLAAQTRAISPGRLDQRLALADPAEELLPWIEQFNALMGRLEQSYAQLEGFNADVAHELRTPLASLIGHTELALSRDRPVAELQETLVGNLEELQRLAAMVNDMLFLSQSDRGAVARRGAPVSLAALAADVVEFHEAAIEDAGLAVRIEGDVRAAIDEPLCKRAVSNLLGNAIRFAERGSQVVIRIAPDETEQIEVSVVNAGPAIPPQHLARLFDRFFRVDSARADGQAHHGLGLAIVAAIARMHAGRTLAESAAGTTRVGFTLATR